MGKGRVYWDSGEGGGGANSWNGGLTVQTSVDGVTYFTRERDEGAASTYNLDANYFPALPPSPPPTPPLSPSPSLPPPSLPLPPLSPPPSPPPSSPPCAYKLMSDTLSWAGAEAACQAAGLQLATVESAARNALLVTAAAGNKVWIGGTDATSEGTWVWSPSNTPVSYTNWPTGQPDNWLGGEDCLMTRHAGGQWNDSPCASKMKYICQQPK